MKVLQMLHNMIGWSFYPSLIMVFVGFVIFTVATRKSKLEIFGKLLVLLGTTWLGIVVVWKMLSAFAELQ